MRDRKKKSRRLASEGIVHASGNILEGDVPEFNALTAKAKSKVDRIVEELEKEERDGDS